MLVKHDSAILFKIWECAWWYIEIEWIEKILKLNELKKLEENIENMVIVPYVFCFLGPRIFLRPTYFLDPRMFLGPTYFFWTHDPWTHVFFLGLCIFFFGLAYFFWDPRIFFSKLLLFVYKDDGIFGVLFWVFNGGDWTGDSGSESIILFWNTGLAIRGTCDMMKNWLAEKCKRIVL